MWPQRPGHRHGGGGDGSEWRGYGVPLLRTASGKPSRNLQLVRGKGPCRVPCEAATAFPPRDLRPKPDPPRSRRSVPDCAASVCQGKSRRRNPKRIRLTSPGLGPAADFSLSLAKIAGTMGRLPISFGLWSGMLGVVGLSKTRRLEQSPGFDFSIAYRPTRTSKLKMQGSCCEQ